MRNGTDLRKNVARNSFPFLIFAQDFSKSLIGDPDILHQVPIQV